MNPDPVIPLGSDLPFGQSAAGLTNVSDAIRQHFQPVTVGLLCSRQIDGYTQTLVERWIQTQGVRIQTPNALKVTKMGERIWQSEDIYFLNNILLKADDLFLFGNLQYRVMVLEPWPEYGYNRYSVIESYAKIYNINPDIVSKAP